MKVLPLGLLYLVLLQFLDCVTTHHALSTGIAVEANPFLRGLMDGFGFLSLYLIKLVCCLLLVGGGLYLRIHCRLFYLILVGFDNTYMTLLVASNFAFIFGVHPLELLLL